MGFHLSKVPMIDLAPAKTRRRCRRRRQRYGSPGLQESRPECSEASPSARPSPRTSPSCHPKRSSAVASCSTTNAGADLGRDLSPRGSLAAIESSDRHIYFLRHAPPSRPGHSSTRTRPTGARCSLSRRWLSRSLAQPTRPHTAWQRGPAPTSDRTRRRSRGHRPRQRAGQALLGRPAPVSRR